MSATRSVPYSSALYDSWSGSSSTPGECRVELQDADALTGGTVLLRLSGDLDAWFNQRLRNVLQEYVGRRLGAIFIDLASVTFVDSTVLGTLVSTRRRCAASGTRLVLRRPCQGVERMFAITRLDRIFDVEPRAA